MATEEIPTIFFSGKSWKKNLGDFLLPPGYDFIQPMGRDGSDVNACYSLFARLSVRLSVLVVVCVVYLKTLPEWLRGHRTAIVR